MILWKNGACHLLFDGKLAVHKDGYYFLSVGDGGSDNGNNDGGGGMTTKVLDLQLHFPPTI